MSYSIFCYWGDHLGTSNQHHGRCQALWEIPSKLLADGHLTKETTETIYSGVVSLRNLRLAMFLAELNNLQMWGADAGNAYLQALTKEKLYIVAGPEFEELQEHVLVMYKALKGTRSGGAC